MDAFGVLFFAFAITWLIIAGTGVLVRLMIHPEHEELEDDINSKD